MYRTLPIVAVVVVACAGPAISFASDTPADLRDLGRSVFSDFVEAFPARVDCIGKVEVRGVHDLTDRARYQLSSGLIELRIPATAAQLTASLLHELGHHLEHSCPEQAGARSSFLEALGLGPDSAWSVPGVYETNPSELWAEAVVRHVSGKPDTRRPLDVPSEAVAVVRRWGEGELSHSAATP
jgi:hypothetical protein